MKKLIFLLATMFAFALTINAQTKYYRKGLVIDATTGDEKMGFSPVSASEAKDGDTLYVKGKVTNASGEEIDGWDKFVVQTTNKKEKTGENQYEFGLNKDFYLRKLEMKYTHEEVMGSQSVKKVEARAGRPLIVMPGVNSLSQFSNLGNGGNNFNNRYVPRRVKHCDWVNGVWVEYYTIEYGTF